MKQKVKYGQVLFEEDRTSSRKRVVEVGKTTKVSLPKLFEISFVQHRGSGCGLFFFQQKQQVPHIHAFNTRS